MHQQRVPEEASAAALGTAAILGILVPVLMVVSNQSAHVTAPLGFAALSVLAFRADRRELWRSLTEMVRSPLGIAIIGLIGWAAVASATSGTPGRSFRILGHLAGISATGFLGVAAASRLANVRPAPMILAAGVGLSSALMLAELHLGMPIHRALGLDAEHYDLNRSLVTAVMLLWPALLALLRVHRPVAVAALIALLIAAAFSSEAGAATLGLLCGLAAWACCRIAPRIAPILICALALAAIAAAPIVSLQALAIIPDNLHHYFESTNSRERALIWHWYAEMIQQAPWTGFGLEATRGIVDRHGVVGLPPEALRVLAMNHPHNAILQVWVELGAVGAMLLSGVVICLIRAVMRFPKRPRALACAAFSAAFAIAFVSHGAWQAWWLATLALCMVWFAGLGAGSPTSDAQAGIGTNVRRA